MRKPAVVMLTLVALLAMSLPTLAASKKKQARESLRKTRALLEQTSEHLDEIAEDAGVEIRFGDGEPGKKTKAKSKEKKKKKGKEKTARLFKKVRKLTSRLHDHAQLLRTALREAGAKRKAKRVKKLKRQLKELKTHLKQIDKEKPQNQLNALREAEAAAGRIQEASRKASDMKSRKAKVGKKIKEFLTGPSNHHQAAGTITDNMKVSVEEMRRISETLRHKDRGASAPREPRVVLSQHAGDLRSEANRLLEYWQGQKDSNRVKLAKDLITRIGPLDKAIQNAPKKPGKKPKALGKLDAALKEVLDNHAQEVLNLAGGAA